jgi:hypothetical protein
VYRSERISSDDGMCFGAVVSTHSLLTSTRTSTLLPSKNRSALSVSLASLFSLPRSPSCSCL